MSSIMTTVYKDGIGNIYADGCPKAVSASSVIYGRENVDMSIVPFTCGANPVPYMTLLKISDPDKGVLWIDETADSFSAKVNGINCCAGTFTGGLELQATEDNVIQSPLLVGKYAIVVNTNNATYIRGADFDQNDNEPGDGMGDTITLTSTFVPEGQDTVVITQ